MKARLAILLVLVFLSTSCSQLPGLSARQAHEGVLDLSDVDISEAGPVDLKGEWEFYWEQLLTPSDIDRGFPSEAIQYVTIPSSWGAQSGSDGDPDEGYATYRMTVHLPSTDEVYALHISPLFTAYRLWIDGELVSSAGIVSDSREDGKPQSKTDSVYFQPKASASEIIVQISNYHFREGGILSPIVLGTDDQISTLQWQKAGMDIFLLSGFLILGIYHFVLYLFRKRDRSVLYFGIFCLIMSFRSIFLGKILLTQYFPEADWALALRIEYLTMYAGLPIFTLFIREMYPDHMWRRFPHLSVGLGVLCYIPVLVLPTRIFTELLVVYQAITVVTSIYLLYVMVKAARAKVEGARMTFGMGIFFLIGILNDILYFNSILLITDNLSSFGLLAFIFSQSMQLAIKLSRAFKQTEELSEQLQELNVTLHNKVQEQTEQLTLSNEDLQRKNEQLTQMENSRKRLISNISHDLKSPLTSIRIQVEAILDGLVHDSHEQKQYLTSVRDKLGKMEGMIHQLFELSKLEKRQMEVRQVTVAVEAWIREMYEMHEWDIRHAGLECDLEVRMDASKEKQPNVYIDEELMERVFWNLIQNAVKFTLPEGKIEISCATQTGFAGDGDFLEVSIRDTGQGISEDFLPHVFERFMTDDPSRNPERSGTGLGLAICKEIIELHGGTIRADNHPERGAVICFTLPVHNWTRRVV